ncbi:hypothetical protein [Kitasatospora purpeofusca]|uniref:hypothetical protein n=1 Tax=Kitasatospora purpeofusca TaxID=67352 RepID=UPI0012FEB34C|nr:hypothetical protein [Kitasatospora purpeofusca]
MIEKSDGGLPAQADEIACESSLPVSQSSLNDGSVDNELLLDPVRTWAACGVSVAAAFYVVVAAVALINCSR